MFIIFKQTYSIHKWTLIDITSLITRCSLVPYSELPFMKQGLNPLQGIQSTKLEGIFVLLLFIAAIESWKKNTCDYYEMKPFSLSPCFCWVVPGTLASLKISLKVTKFQI